MLVGVKTSIACIGQNSLRKSEVVPMTGMLNRVVWSENKHCLYWAELFEEVRGCAHDRHVEQCCVE